ncbi:MAG: hypothetical protein E6614_16570 [Bradyrhizobium sp.]|uniref:Uncharacterized protein n=1 Tax=Bradyrhizobium denitrificans TaxID=2734912 RepID=A0ABS5GA55_9BRAD|nr:MULTISPECIES: hypothetical protein [Bradyrhizobium]MBR1138149.1 hypothetical protein [Bradyrhizobium denitrificans]MDU0957286.1 hypothetical protein [Bradyrhizobium sp.]MDU1497418.1 hypothetical protein [Bradyrhizobium sp.]MDU1547696.1 hypothetical protein [Bradyrhizobium sp.]MDU1670289.1 hypothetical protein [Bradyrhizobium sp.]
MPTKLTLNDPEINPFNHSLCNCTPAGLAPHLDMTDQWQASRKMMLFHLEAASSYAEELGEATTLHLIDRTRREIEQPFLEEQAYESKPPSVA